MRLGIFGGTFDPIHYGHLLLAESCREQVPLDEVWFLPAAVPPHKQQRRLAGGRERAEMIELAVGGHPAFKVCRVEIDRGGISYTVDTLAALHEQDATRELFLLMGADTLFDLPNWKQPQRLCQLALPVIVGRGRAGGVDDPLALEVFKMLIDSQRLATVLRHPVEMPLVELSSSDLRARVAGGQSIRFRTPRAVEEYIAAHGLYSAAAATPA